MAFAGEVDTFVIYDIEENRVRNRIAEVCKDYGLERVQYSAFFGSLSRNLREELFEKLKSELGRKGGKIWVQPVCEKDSREALELEQVAADDGDASSAGD